MSLSDLELIKKFNIKENDKVLDVGGSMMQHKGINIDTLVDIIRPEEAPYSPSKLLAKNFVKLDFMKDKLPFRDREFDFCLCTHVLEDLSYPFSLIKEMSRVSKRGYIATPSMGKDITFSHVDMTDWLTGIRRVPGLSHHKWLFYKKGSVLKVLPKNYGILYSGEFNYIKWKGEEETQYYWEKNINFEEVKDLDVHILINEYRKYIKLNKSDLIKGITHVYLDNPIYFIKEIVKLILKRGMGFNKR